MRCESPQSTHGLVAGDKSLLFFVFPSIDTIRSSSDKLWIWILRVLKWCSETIDENELGLVGQAGAHFPYFIHPLGRARLSRSPVRHKKVRKSERAKERKTEGESGHKLAIDCARPIRLNCVSGCVCTGTYLIQIGSWLIWYRAESVTWLVVCLFLQSFRCEDRSWPASRAPTPFRPPSSQVVWL